MNKTIYIAPEVEQIKVRFEENIMSDVQRANVVNATDNGWQWENE